MKKTLIASSIVLFYACHKILTRWEESEPQHTVQELNKYIASDRVQDTSFTESPEHIARLLFPRENVKAAASYSITVKVSNEDFRLVTVEYEGAVNEELTGERHLLDLTREGGQWTISDYRYFLKRR